MAIKAMTRAVGASRWVRTLVGTIVAAACLFVPVTAAAQTTAGSVVGTVVDQSGAVVPGVQISVRNSGTGATYETTSADNGGFGFPVVAVGPYEFSAVLAGFKTVTGTFNVALNSRQTLAIVLAIGETSEAVEVVGLKTAVETTGTQVGEAFSTRDAVDLPLPSANVNSLALLSTNTVDINTTGLTRGQLLNRVSSPVGGAIGAIGGSRARGNNFTLDGVDNNDPIGTGPQGGVIQDAVQEFSVLKNSFNAEFGQGVGGQFNIVTKSGTNSFQGSAFWYLQSDALNTADILTQRALQSGRLTEKPDYDYDRFGFTLGGPIRKNRLFFFGAYEYERTQGASTSTAFEFPTQQGYDLLAALPPGTTRGGLPGRVSPFSLAYLREWGLVAPTALAAARFPVVLGTAIPIGAISQNIPSFAKNHRALANADANFGVNDLVQFRYNYDRGPNGVVPGAPREDLNAQRRATNHLASFQWVRTLTPRLLNEARLAYHRQKTFSSTVDPDALAVPNLQVGEIALSIGPSGAVPGGTSNEIWQLIDNLTWQSGRSLWKFGVDLRSNGVNDINLVSPRGNYRWVSLEEFLLDNPPTQVGQRGLGAFERVLDTYSINWFVQDEIRLGRWTVNAGLRYEYNSLPRDLALQEVSAPASVPGVIEFARPSVDKNNWAPRVGFAWDVTGDGRTAVRGGYGLSYSPVFGAYVGGGLLPAALQQVFFSTTCLPNCPIPVPNINFLERGGIPNQLLPLDTPEHIRSATASYVPDVERPRLQTFTVEFEREITSGLLGKVRYLHTKGDRLSVQAQLNAGIVPPQSAFVPTWFNPSEVPSQADLDRLPTVPQFLAQVVRPYDQYGFAASTLTTHLPIAESKYDGVSFEVERRYLRGLQLNVNYTWSRSYDHATNEFFNSFMNPRRPQDWRNLDNEWGRSVLDVPHRFVASGLWDLPWWREEAGAKGLLGGWTVSVVYVKQSGQPWTPLSQTNAVGNNDVQVQRAIFNPNGTADIGTIVNPIRNTAGAIVGYLSANPAARFVQAGVGSFPTAERNSLRAPGINNVDVALSKNFRLRATHRIQIQGQVFNLLNNPQFTGANLLAVDPGLGLNYAFVANAGFNNMDLAGGTGGSRVIQLVLKYLF